MYQCYEKYMFQKWFDNKPFKLLTLNLFLFMTNDFYKYKSR